jgi:heptosyltransferase II
MKNLHPETPLGLICRKGLGSTLKDLGVVDYYWEIQKSDRQSYKNVLLELKKFNVQNLVAAHTSFRTTLFCSQIRASNKITFAKPWNFFSFNERIKWQADLPESLRLLSLLEKHSPRINELFSDLPSYSDFVKKDFNGKLTSPPEWAVVSNLLKFPRAVKLAEDFGLKDKPWIALFPGSVWATKMWNAESFIQLGQILEKRGFQIVVMGGPEEKSLGESVAQGITGALNLCGKTTLIESLSLLSLAKLVVGNDSSSSHMAAVVGRPVVAIFGPTVLSFGYRPWAKKSAVVELENLKCRPCGPHGHRKCPLNHHHCMKWLKVEPVLKAIDALLFS